MPVGFTIVNDSGIYQIDEASIVPCLQQKGQVTLNAEHQYSAFGRCTYTDVTYSGTANSMPFVAVRANKDLICGLERTTKNGNTYTFRITAGGSPSTSRLIDYYIFDVPRPAPSGFGWELYRDDGTLQFSAAKPPMVFLGPLQNTYATNDYAIAGSVWWDSVENIDTEDGQIYFYRWAYILRGPRRLDNGGEFTLTTVNEQSGQGYNGLPGGPPQGFAENNFAAVLRVNGY